MKKKNTTYILISVVIVIWGLLAFRLFDMIPDSEIVAVKKNKKINLNLDIKKDTFSISGNYRDPFLNVKKIRPKKASSKFKVVKKKEIVFPNINYKGTIINSKGKASYMIDINFKAYLIKKGETKSEVKLISGDKQKIKVLYQGNYKIIDKSS